MRGAKLSALEVAGFVERRSTPSHSQWRLTQKGAAELRTLGATSAPGKGE